MMVGNSVVYIFIVICLFGVVWKVFFKVYNSYIIVVVEVLGNFFFNMGLVIIFGIGWEVVKVEFMVFKCFFLISVLRRLMILIIILFLELIF